LGGDYSNDSFSCYGRGKGEEKKGEENRGRCSAIMEEVIYNSVIEEKNEEAEVRTSKTPQTGSSKGKLLGWNVEGLIYILN